MQRNLEPSYKKSLENNIWKFYVFLIFRWAALFTPVLVLFLQDNGLSMQEVMILQSFFAIMMVLMEIPSGYFADIVGRKQTIIISATGFFLGCLVYAIGNNFWIFFLSEIFWGIGVSFISGADSAFIYDSLMELGREKEYKKIWGNALFYGMIALMIFNVAGGYIGEISYRLTFVGGLPFYFIAIIVACTLKEPKKHKLIVKKGYVKELFKIVKFTLKDHTELRWLIIYAGVVFSFNQVALWMYQPYMQLSGLTIAQIGLAFGSFQIISGLSSKYSGKIEKYLGKNKSLAILFVLTATSYLLMSNVIILMSFSFIFLQQFVRGFMNVIITDYVNELVPSNIRATVLSVQSMIKRLIYAVLLPIVGYVVDAYDLITAFKALSITLFIVGAVILVITFKYLSETKTQQD